MRTFKSDEWMHAKKGADIPRGNYWLCWKKSDGKFHTVYRYVHVASSIIMNFDREDLNPMDLLDRDDGEVWLCPVSYPEQP